MIDQKTTLEEDLADFYSNPVMDTDALFQRVNAEAPVVRDPTGTWLVGSHELANEVARNQTAVWHRRNPNRKEADLRPLERFRYYNMVSREGADHDRLRNLVSQAFTARAVVRLERRITDIVNELIDGVIEKGSMNLVEEYSYPLPILVISEMMGLPEEDRHHIVDVANAVVLGNDYQATEADKLHAEAVIQVYTDMITRQIEQRRREPSDDLLTALADAAVDGDTLSGPELISVSWELAVAGHETTASLISSLTYRLLSQRELWEQVCADPSLVPQAIEEGLRFDPPLRIVGARHPDRDVDLGGVHVAANERTSLFVAAANRDKRVFSDPDTFRLDRTKNPHLGFSAGRHFCMGAQLARLEARVAIDALVRRLPGMRLKEPEARWRNLVHIHALEELQVEW